MRLLVKRGNEKRRREEEEEGGRKEPVMLADYSTIAVFAIITP